MSTKYVVVGTDWDYCEAERYDRIVAHKLEREQKNNVVDQYLTWEDPILWENGELIFYNVLEERFKADKHLIISISY